MKIGIMHFHLKKGGVGSVIKHQLEALKHTADCLAISGMQPEIQLNAETVVVPDIQYDGTRVVCNSPRQIADRIADAVRERMGGLCDILHVHNPTLRKNSLYLQILKALQDKGMNLLLQIHDFAEDNRPNAYFSDEEYPADCHYAVINSRDHTLLLKAGLCEKGLHLLSNTVVPLQEPQPSHAPSSRIVYPVRGIRRKNIGEVLLLSMFLEKGKSIGITLPPHSMREKRRYVIWKSFAVGMKLPVEFEIGLEAKFQDIVGSSHCFLSTSINEGFGFSFAEPWTAGRYMTGRRIDHVCRDFESNGLDLSHLYSAINVPFSLFDRKAFAVRWKQAARSCAKSFGIAVPEHELSEAFDRMCSKDTADFSHLDEFAQQETVSNLMDSPEKRNAFKAMNPHIEGLFDISDKSTLIESNKAAVLSAYAAEKYRALLIRIYEQTCTESVKHSIDKHLLLSEFVKPDSFHILGAP